MAGGDGGAYTLARNTIKPIANLGQRAVNTTKPPRRAALKASSFRSTRADATHPAFQLACPEGRVGTKWAERTGKPRKTSGNLAAGFRTDARLLDILNSSTETTKPPGGAAVYHTIALMTFSPACPSLHVGHSWNVTQPLSFCRLHCNL